MSFAADYGDLFRRAAGFVDAILKGASPAAVPVEPPRKFDLTVNLKTARALGLTIPASIKNCKTSAVMLSGRESRH